MNSQKNNLAPETNDIPSFGLELKHVGVGSNLILIKMKTCNKCGENKSENYFYIRPNGRLRNECKKCRANYNKKYFSENKDVLMEYAKNWNLNNPENRKASINRYIQKDPVAYNLRIKINRDKNKPKKNKAEKEKRDSDHLYRMKGNLRSRTLKVFKRIGLNKPTKSENLLGIDWIGLKEYIEKKLKDGMRWGNYGRGGWHIDHIIPLAYAKNETELISLCHYTNLQPLWEKENFSKGDKIFNNGEYNRFFITSEQVKSSLDALRD